MEEHTKHIGKKKEERGKNKSSTLFNNKDETKKHAQGKKVMILFSRLPTIRTIVNCKYYWIKLKIYYILEKKKKRNEKSSIVNLIIITKKT